MTNSNSASTTEDTFSAASALTRGYDRLGSGNAWFIIIVMVIYSIILQQTFGSASGIEAFTGLIIILLYPFVMMALLIISFRVFILDPEEPIWRNLKQQTGLLRPIIWPTINGLLGSVIFFSLYILGLVVFVVPGIFVGATFGFFFAFIALENDRFTMAMRKSWRLSQGDRMELMAMVFGLLVLTVGYLVVTFLLWNMPITGAIVGGAALVYYVAVFSESFRMLTGNTSSEISSF